MLLVGFETLSSINPLFASLASRLNWTLHILNIVQVWQFMLAGWCGREYSVICDIWKFKKKYPVVVSPHIRIPMLNWQMSFVGSASSEKRKMSDTPTRFDEYEHGSLKFERCLWIKEKTSKNKKMYESAFDRKSESWMHEILFHFDCTERIMTILARVSALQPANLQVLAGNKWLHYFQYNFWIMSRRFSLNNS